MWFVRSWRPRRVSSSACARWSVRRRRCVVNWLPRRVRRCGLRPIPGEQLQIDFGERRVEIGGVAVKVFFFVATLGYSRRLHVRAYGNERQDSWFDGLESAFSAFGGVPREVLLDNAKALILHHDPASREVALHPRLHAFARHWGFRIRACAPYRAHTKDKNERGVGYVKRNAIAGRRFATWSEMAAHLEAWTREIADQRVHGTAGEPPGSGLTATRPRPSVRLRAPAIHDRARSAASRWCGLCDRGGRQRLPGAMAADR
jgi:integrase-like protein